MLFQVHASPHANGKMIGQTKWKGESHINDGPYACGMGEWISVGEVCELARQFAEFSDAGLAKVSAVIGPTVVRRVESLLQTSGTLQATASAQQQELENVLAERDDLARRLAQTEAGLADAREELLRLTPIHELAVSVVREPSKQRAKVAA